MIYRVFMMMMARGMLIMPVDHKNRDNRARCAPFDCSAAAADDSEHV